MMGLEETKAQRPRPRRRLWRRAIGIPLLLISAFVLWKWITLSMAATRRLEAAIAVAERDDPHWRIGDLMAHREEVPDEENSAFVVAEAVALLPEGWPKGPDPDPDEPPPPPTELGEAFDQIAKPPGNRQLDATAIGLLRGELETYGESVRIGRTVANYDRGRHELELTPAVFDMPLEETQSARSLAKLLATDSAIRAHDGDADGALESCRAIIGIGRSIGDEPFVTSQLVRTAIGSTAMKSVSRALGQGEPSDEVLAQLQALILKEMGEPLLLNALRGERAGYYERLRLLGNGELTFESLGGEPNASGGLAETFLSWYFLPWTQYQLDDQLAACLEWSNEPVAIARQPIALRLQLWKDWKASYWEAKRRPGYAFLKLPFIIMYPTSVPGLNDIRYQSELGATAILLAAERHRRKAGDWPASIAEISREILPDPPLDPCSGEPFLIERRDGQFIVYSVGINLIDEHGEFDPKRWIHDTDDSNARAWDVPLRRQPPADLEVTEEGLEEFEGEMEGAGPFGPAPPEMP